MNKLVLNDEEEIAEIQKIRVFLFGCILSKPSVALLAKALASTLLALLTSLAYGVNEPSAY